MINTKSNVIVEVLSLLCVLSLILKEVTALKCSYSDGCESCCEGKCCTDSATDGPNNKVTYEYRLSFWNLWYFWFVILFLLMSCFGGCGYYKQRQRYTQTRGAFLSGSTSRSSCPRTRAANFVVENPVTPYYAYTGPAYDAQTNINLQPPPYSEVMAQPENFPVNKWEMGLPSYSGPGPEYQNPSMPLHPAENGVSPPAYSEQATESNQSPPNTTDQAPPHAINSDQTTPVSQSSQ